MRFFLKFLLCVVHVSFLIIPGLCQNLPLPALPYTYNALEPYIDEATMRLHHLKHHQTYTDKMNDALLLLRSSSPEMNSIAKTGIDAILTQLNTVQQQEPKLAKALRNHGGGYVNHDLFWRIMGPPGSGNFSIVVSSSSVPTTSSSRAIEKAIVAKFGSFRVFQNSFAAEALGIFGSGWVWLEVDLLKVALARDAAGGLAVTDAFVYPFLNITVTQGQDTPSMEEGRFPLLALDVWEHAYYLKYNNRRAEYIDAFWNVVNWNEVDARFQTALRHLHAAKSPLNIKTTGLVPTGINPSLHHETAGPGIVDHMDSGARVAPGSVEEMDAEQEEIDSRERLAKQSNQEL